MFQKNEQKFFFDDMLLQDFERTSNLAQFYEQSESGDHWLQITKEVHSLLSKHCF